LKRFWTILAILRKNFLFTEEEEEGEVGAGGIYLVEGKIHSGVL
jgi:hypothetical protein